jgi:hypothetical protein
MNHRQSDSDNQKITYQFLECIIPNFLGWYLNSYVGFALSVILLLWHWQNEMECDRSHKSLLTSLAVIILLILTHPKCGSSTTAIAPPLVGIQRVNCHCPLQSMKNRFPRVK